MAYLAPIHRPSSIRHALRLNLTSPTSTDLVIAKSNRLEIWSPSSASSEGYTLLHSCTLYGRILLLEWIRPSSSTNDHLFVVTDQYNYFTLSWDSEHHTLKTSREYVCFAEKAARDGQFGDRVRVDPTGRFMAIECYEGIVNVLPLTRAPKKGKQRVGGEEVVVEVQEQIPVRIPELGVRDSCFVVSRDDKARLMLLCEDGDDVELKMRVLEYGPSLKGEMATADLERVERVEGRVEAGASHLIPLPLGVLVLGETSIAYADGKKVVTSQPLEEPTVWVAWCMIDNQRYVLADDFGRAFIVLVLVGESGAYTGHLLKRLGSTSRANVMVYLGEGRLFVGSHQGDSQVVEMVEDGLNVIQTFSNLAPVLDFTVMDLGNRSPDAIVNEFSSGQARIVTGSGAFADGSLRSIRSGVNLQRVGSLGDMGAPIEALFSLRRGASADTLLISSAAGSRVFCFDSEGNVNEADALGGLVLDEQTVYAANVDDLLIQVTPSTVLATNLEDGVAFDSWQPPTSKSIIAVAAVGEKLLISIEGTQLIVLALENGHFNVLAERTFDDDKQVSCIAFSPSAPNVCFAGFWSSGEVSSLDVKTLDTIASQRVAEGEIILPRSLAVTQIVSNQPPTLLVGLADGTVVSYLIESAEQPFAARRSIILGAQQPELAIIPRSDSGTENVFVSSEYSSLIYGSEGHIAYSAITDEDAQRVCSFDCEAFPGAIAMAVDSEVKLAIIGEERITKIQTLKVGESARRMAYSGAYKAFGLGCVKRSIVGEDEVLESHFKLVDEVTFKVLDTYPFNPDELVESVIRCAFEDEDTDNARDRFVVGTARLDDSEPGANEGGIYIFEIDAQRKLKVVCVHNTYAPVRCLGICHDHIVAGLVKTVVIYESRTESNGLRLSKKAAYRTSTAPIDLCVSADHNTIAVADLMKSITILNFDPATYDLTETSRHFDSIWTTAVAAVGPPAGETTPSYLLSSASGRLILLQSNTTGATALDRRHLEPISEMSLGEAINRIHPLSHNLHPTSSAIVLPRAFLATVNGGVYIFCHIAEGKKDLLIRLQTALARRVTSLGGLSFNSWRGGGNESGPVRFVDGELVERFLEMDPEMMQEISAEVDMDSVKVREIVEELRRVR
ncbi:hypothetical protein K470DRAFT_254672 [Piedraia hortae CBS 480.64]|uniref:DNA damage-binding protein 1 n=1 Tax=Piedraia hortae CBS 480.64 TaxID=1314780 RepID=A0A6A7C9M4_9PEZI|nr:hypothetical protein K470DRAFT_254672 [Piedraia hortae CBS 480.64]